MKQQNVTSHRYALILGTFLVLGIFLYALRSVLLPFVVGIIVAYFLDPFVRRLSQNHKISRGVATSVVLGLFLLILLPVILLLGAAAVTQIGEFVGNMPQYLSSFGQKLTEWVHRLQVYFPALSLENVENSLRENFGESVKPVAKIIRGVIANGFAFVNILSLLLIAPVVAFYMLRDWPTFTGKIYDLIPKKHLKDVTEGLAEVSRIISGYLRGQSLVCVILGSFYAFGLWIVGLNLGLVVGFLAGVISFIPYVGSISGFLMAMILVITQYGTLPKILEVIVVFGIGQFLEGNFLTPKLVGENIGLHPVWVMFSLLAGGALLGLLGMIIAVPIAACLGVLLRYLIAKYKKSSIYKETA